MIIYATNLIKINYMRNVPQVLTLHGKYLGDSKPYSVWLNFSAI